MPAACYVVLGLLLNAVLLLAPLALTGTLHTALSDRSVKLFLVLASLFCLGDLISLCFPFAREPVRSRSREKVAGLALATGLTLLLTFWVALLEHAWRPRGAETSTLWLAIASAAMLAGIGVRTRAVLTLGSYFTSEIEVREGQPLVRNGIYAYLRHPSELGLLVSAFGGSLVLRSALSATLCALALLPLVWVRMKAEDRALEAAFGEEFRRFARETRRFAPFFNRDGSRSKRRGLPAILPLPPAHHSLAVGHDQGAGLNLEPDQPH